MTETALFVIDIQNELAGGSSTDIPAAQRIRDTATALLKKARGIVTEAVEREEPPPITLVFVQHEESPDQGTLNRGTEPWELVFPPSESSPYEQLVAKSTRDTFESNPGLAAELRAKGIKNIVTFGIQSECCVLETSKGALQAGFNVTLLSGAHSTYDTKTKTAAEIEKDVEIELKDKGAAVIEWADW